MANPTLEEKRDWSDFISAAAGIENIFFVDITRPQTVRSMLGIYGGFSLLVITKDGLFIHPDKKSDLRFFMSDKKGFAKALSSSLSSAELSGKSLPDHIKVYIPDQNDEDETVILTLNFLEIAFSKIKGLERKRTGRIFGYPHIELTYASEGKDEMLALYCKGKYEPNSEETDRLFKIIKDGMTKN